MANEWNEFNDVHVSEFFSSAHEFTQPLANAMAPETTTSPDNSVPTEKIKRKSNSSLVAKLVTMSLATTTVAVGTTLTSNAIKVEVASLTADATAIYYDIDVPTTQDEIVLILENDFTKREIPLFTGDNVGAIEDLASGVKYTLLIRNITGIDTTLQTHTVRTLKQTQPQPPEPITQFNQIVYTSAENATGTFTFTPSFKDEKEIWSNMTAVLSDSSAYAQTEVEITNADTMYEIKLANVPFVTSKGTLAIWADVLEENGQTTRKIVYEQDVKMTKTRSYIQTVTMTPAEYINGPAYLVVEYIDENDWWTDNMVYCRLIGDDIENYLEASITETGGVADFWIHELFCEGDSAILELFILYPVNDGYEEIIIQAQTVVIKAPDYYDNTNTSTGDYGTDTGTDTGST